MRRTERTLESRRELTRTMCYLLPDQPSERTLPQDWHGIVAGLAVLYFSRQSACREHSHNKYNHGPCIVRISPATECQLSANVRAEKTILTGTILRTTTILPRVSSSSSLACFADTALEAKNTQALLQVEGNFPTVLLPAPR